MKKFNKLKKILNKMRKVVIAYSGGLDSAFLLKAAIDTLGRQNVLAVTARSETYPLSEYKEAARLAKKIGARHITIHTKELGLKKFRSNPVNRCYYCKKELFKKLDEMKDKFRMTHVVDGTNLDDLKDIRHGMKAAEELNIRHPLLEAGITKADIRKFSKQLKLPTWDKPSMACLASRIPFNSAISKPDLVRIGKAEDYLRKLGFKQVRVRTHKDIARMEFFKKDFHKAVILKDKIVCGLKALGFVYVTLDLAGYRTGSMHEAA